MINMVSIITYAVLVVLGSIFGYIYALSVQYQAQAASSISGRTVYSTIIISLARLVILGVTISYLLQNYKFSSILFLLGFSGTISLTLFNKKKQQDF